jgi:hydroxymethylpyrimidine pyrophosphatase-like HAD family hydrolase
MKRESFFFSVFSKICIITLCSLELAISTCAHSEEYEITEISEIKPFLKHYSPEETIIFLDWDNTVTKKDGEDTEFRELETQKIIQEMQTSGYDILVITSRLKGASIDSLTINGTRPEAIHALNNYLCEMDKSFNLFTKQKTIKSLSLDTGAVLVDLEINENLKDYMIITNNIIFAGSHDPIASNKGPALVKLLDLNNEGSKSSEPDDGPIFSSDRVHKKVIFIDNDPDHIQSVKTAFEKRDEKLLLLYYPQDEDS